MPFAALDEQFRLLVDHLPLGILVGLEQRIAYLNPEALRIFRAPDLEQLIGSPIADRIPQPWRNHVEERIQRLKGPEGRVDATREQMLRVDGTLVSVEVSAVRSAVGGRPGAILYIRDLSAEDQAAQELAAKTELLAMTGNMAQVGGWEFDVATGQGTWTEPVAAIHDFDPRAPTNVSIGLEHFDPETRPTIVAAVERLIRDGTPYDLTLPLISAQRRRKWVRTLGFPVWEGGKVVRARGTMQDVTEITLERRSLEEEKERLSITLRSIGDAVITTDLEGRVVLMSRSAEELTGWPLAEARGQLLDVVLPLIHEWTRQTVENPVHQVLREGCTVEMANHTVLVGRQGKELVIADSAAPIRDRDGSIQGVVLVFRDMTEKKRLNEALQRAQNLESIGLLAAGIAHDFNNLLAGLFGQVQLAMEKLRDQRTDDARLNLDRALGVFNRARDLTTQLLTFSKGGQPVRSTFDISGLVRKTALFALSGSNVEVSFEMPPGPLQCVGDENQLAQAVENLIINARQAMQEGGQLHITVGTRPDPKGCQIAVAVRDNGPGMAPEVVERIFDPFFSTKATGHGLGLATVQSILQHHEGRVEVQSSPGNGSTFTLVFPQG